VGRGVLPIGRGYLTVFISDPDEDVLALLPLMLDAPRDRRILVDPQAVEERWLGVVASLLAERG
jgi:hypothetical protein